MTTYELILFILFIVMGFMITAANLMIHARLKRLDWKRKVLEGKLNIIADVTKGQHVQIEVITSMLKDRKESIESIIDILEDITKLLKMK